MIANILNTEFPNEYNDIDYEALDLAKKLKHKELEIDEIKKNFRYSEFEYKKKIQELQSDLTAEKEITKGLFNTEKNKPENAIDFDNFQEEIIEQKEREIFRLKQAIFDLKMKIIQTNEENNSENFNGTTETILKKHCSVELFDASSKRINEENRKKNICEAENTALKQTIEKIKEGAIEVLIEKEKEILSLKMKLESFSLTKRASIRDSRNFQFQSLLNEDELKTLRFELESLKTAYDNCLNEREQEKKCFIQEISELNAKLEEKEKLHANQIYKIECEYQNSFDKKISEFVNYSQTTEEKLLSELQITDEKLKIAELSIINLRNERENEKFLAQKAKNEHCQVEKSFEQKLKEKEQKELKLSTEIYELKETLSGLSHEITEKSQNIAILEGKIQEMLKQSMSLKNQIIEKDFKIAKITELYENSSFIKEHTANISKETEKPLIISISNQVSQSPPLKVPKNSEILKMRSRNNTEIKTNEKSKDFKEEALSYSNFNDVESNDSIADEEFNLNERDLTKLQRINAALEQENKIVLEKNEILMLFLKEKDEEIMKLSEKLRKNQSVSEDYQREIQLLSDEIKRVRDNRNKSVYEKNFNLSQNTCSIEQEQKIKELEKKLMQTKEEWANLVNFLNEELSLAERVAAEAKVKYVEEATQKEYFQFKYNFLLTKLKKNNTLKETLKK